MVVGPRDSTLISLGGAVGSSSPVVKVTVSDAIPRPTSFSAIIELEVFRNYCNKIKFYMIHTNDIHFI
jgi:hypothetical protein